MSKARARELGIRLSGTPGIYNAITDVPGVEVGFCTVTKGEPEDYKGPGSAFARTGVTAILPRGRKKSAVFAGTHDLNGNGELTGMHWLDDSGFMHGPLLITNTNSVGVVRDAAARWMIENSYYHPYVYEGRVIDGIGYFYPTVGETWDGLLNDTNGFHVTTEHALEALNSAKGGPVAEGNVGGGAGMICYDFKGGTGTASRKLGKEDGGYSVGVLVQANHGQRPSFMVQGVSMSEAIKGCDPDYKTLTPKPGTGSIIVIVATDAPVLPWQLAKICKRVPIGIGRLGAYGDNGSGDIFLAFSTANENAYTNTVARIDLLGDDMMDPLYVATIEAVEEAVLNALCAAETMVGREFNKCCALDQGQLVDVLKKHGKI